MPKRSDSSDGGIYPTDSTFDGSSLVGEPGFWPAYYLNQSVDDEELVTRVWDVSLSTVRDMQARLARAEAWPRFEVRIGEGVKISVIHRNFPDDPGVDYFLIPGPSRDPIRMATLEGNYQGPGISWQEIKGVASAGCTPGERAVRLLLLGPMLGDVEAEDEGEREVLTEALRSTGGSIGAAELAHLIVADNLQWEPAQWRETHDGLTLCDAPSSPRSLDGPTLSPFELKVVSDLLRQ